MERILTFSSASTWTELNRTTLVHVSLGRGWRVRNRSVLFASTSSQTGIQKKIKKTACLTTDCSFVCPKLFSCSPFHLFKQLLDLTHVVHSGNQDSFTTSFLHSFLFSTALWDLSNSRPVHSLTLSSHLFLCLPCLLPPFTVPCKMVLARSDERETWPCHCSLRLFTMVRRASCGPIACWILARTPSLVTRS